MQREELQYSATCKMPYFFALHVVGSEILPAVCLKSKPLEPNRVLLSYADRWVHRKARRSFQAFSQQLLHNIAHHEPGEARSDFRSIVMSQQRCARGTSAPLSLVAGSSGAKSSRPLVLMTSTL